tara:strand:+ start:114603 stop:115316 length:714 start_codon:yes stop_codon:yes gene_type:complete
MLTTQSLRAYDYHIVNLGSRDIYVDIIFAAKGTGFIGDTGASDSWKLKGPQKVAAHDTADFKFVGVFCLHTILVGESVDKMAPVYLTKAKDDRESYDAVFSTLAVVSSNASKVVGKAPVVGTAAGLILTAFSDTVTPLGSIFKDALCANYTFCIAPNPFRVKGRVAPSQMTAGFISKYLAVAKYGNEVSNEDHQEILKSAADPEKWKDEDWWDRVGKSVAEGGLKNLLRAVKAAKSK